MGDVLQRSFRLWLKILYPFGLYYLAAASANEANRFLVHERAIPDDYRSGLTELAFSLLSIAGGIFADGLCVVAAANAAHGQENAAVTVLRSVVRRFLPLLATWCISGIIALFGCFLLLAPGVFASATFFVVGPSCLLERLGPLQSMRRSAKLTKGNRLKISGLVIAEYVPAIVAGGLAVMAQQSRLPFAPIIVLAAVLQSLLGSFTAVLAYVVFQDLASDAGGVSSAQIAAVFD